MGGNDFTAAVKGRVCSPHREGRLTTSWGNDIFSKIRIHSDTVGCRDPQADIKRSYPLNQSREADKEFMLFNISYACFLFPILKRNFSMIRLFF
jgi:hypothetical protein